MNLLGKIFTLLILLLSVCFFMVAVMVGMSHQNWRVQAEENKRVAERYLTARDQILSEVARKDARLREEQVMRMQVLQQLQSQLVASRTDLEQKEVELASALAISQERLAELRRIEDRLAEQTTEVEQLMAQNRTLVDDIARQREKVVELTNQRFELERSFAELERLRNDLAEENALLTKVMKVHGLTRHDMADVPPVVDGVVTSASENLVVVSLGRDDGVRNGHVLDVYREGRYVGTVTVTDARHNRSVARVVPEMTRLPVQTGDRVTTEWSRLPN